MKAQVITQFGVPTVFNMVTLPKPTLKPGHVLVRALATSVNQIDCKIRSGLVPNISPVFPAILHGDVAGVIDSVADDVDNFQAGDEIYGCIGGLRGSTGALAEFILVDAKLIAKKPKSLTMSEAAALPLVSITAWEALFSKTDLKAHQTILIHGGLGGVGHVAIQLARWKQAKVYTTVLDNADFALAKALGADEVINAKEEEVTSYLQRLTNGDGFDVVFDTVGGINLDKSLVAAAINGKVVTTAARSTHDLTPMHNKALNLYVVFMLLPILTGKSRDSYGTILNHLSTIIDEGKLKPLIDTHQFEFQQISDAHAFLESGKAKGKVVVTIGGE